MRTDMTNAVLTSEIKKSCRLIQRVFGHAGRESNKCKLWNLHKTSFGDGRLAREMLPKPHDSIWHLLKIRMKWPLKRRIWTVSIPQYCASASAVLELARAGTAGSAATSAWLILSCSVEKQLSMGRSQAYLPHDMGSPQSGHESFPGSCRKKLPLLAATEWCCPAGVITSVVVPQIDITVLRIACEANPFVSLFET